MVDLVVCLVRIARVMTRNRRRRKSNSVVISLRMKKSSLQDGLMILFVNMSILPGCDYCENVAKLGVPRAHKLVRVYSKHQKDPSRCP